MHKRIAKSKRIVIKVGTQIIIRENGSLAEERLQSLVNQSAKLASEGKEVLIVSSGAIGLGRQALRKGNAKLSLSEKQACAAVGQSLLMNLYGELFGQHQLVTAQLLLTAFDLSDRQRYLNLRETLEKLLEMRVIPIINENDTISTTEIQEDKTRSFGDNDKLSALVASKLGADLLIILTNVDGVYSENPVNNPDAKLISLIDGFEQLKDIETGGKSTYGRGGMISKLEAVKIASISGVHTVITSGLKENTLTDIFTKDEIPGTLVLSKNRLPGRKRWLALASGYNGIVIINEGAKKALVENHTSLLPIGITAVNGDFQSHQVVSIQDEQGIEVGRGLINFSAEDTRKILGHQSREIPLILGNVEGDVVIQRDNLVIYQEYET